LSELSYSSPIHSLWCGVEGNYDYNTGSRVNTAVISPSIYLPYGAEFITLGFWENFNTEYGWDICMVDISTNDGNTWIQLRTPLSGSSAGWVYSEIDLSGYQGETIQLRFYFDTDDEVANDYPGWFVDDISIVACSSWLTIEMEETTIFAGESQDIEVTFDASELLEGTYNAIISISSNDPVNQMVEIPVTLNVYYETPDYFSLTLLTNPNDIGANVSGAGDYSEGEIVNISTSSVSNYLFTGWTGSEEDITLLENPLAMNTSFVMPGREVTYIANYEFQTTFSVSFYVRTNNNNPVFGAIITISGEESITTNIDGVATTILENGTYSFTITATDYEIYNDVFSISGSNRNIICILTPVSTEIQTILSFEVYPNPFDSSITLKGAQDINRIIITNILGQRVIDIKIIGSEQITIPTEVLIDGIYMIIFEANHGERLIRKMIKQH